MDRTGDRKKMNGRQQNQKRKQEREGSSYQDTGELLTLIYWALCFTCSSSTSEELIGIVFGVAYGGGASNLSREIASHDPSEPKVSLCALRFNL